MKLHYKKIILGLLFGLYFKGHAQVGVNTTNPQAQLDITASNSATPSNTDGLLIPRIDNFPATSPTATQQGMLVYLTTTVGVNVPGFYYWDNPTTSWKSVGQSAVETDPQVSSSGSNYIPKWNGTTLVDGQVFDNGTSIGVGTATPLDKLHVVGNIRVDNGKIPFVNTGGSVFIGDNAGLNDDLSSNVNTFIGTNAGRNNTVGSGNVALGLGASQAATTGLQNVALGSNSLRNNLVGSSNTVVGSFAGENATGSSNLFLGYTTGQFATGNSNVFIGNSAGKNETGNSKLYIDNSDTVNPLIYGDFATNLLRVNGTLNVNNAYNLPTTAGTANQVLQTNGAGVTSWVNPSSLSITETDPQVSSTTTNYIPKWNGTTLVDGQVFDNGTNVGIGTATPTDKVHVVGNMKIDGGKIPFVNTGNSVFIGENAGIVDDLSDNRNVFVGSSSGKSTTTGNQNMFSGAFSGELNTTGYWNVAIGAYALNRNTTGNENVAVGKNALSFATTADVNVAVGSNAGVRITTGTNNAILGAGALYNSTTGSDNIVIGAQSMLLSTTGNSNVSIGSRAGYSNSTGSRNIFLGNYAGYNENGSDKLYIDNTFTSTPLIYGDFATDLLRVNGTLNVNNAYNLPNTAGIANQVLQTNGAGVTSWVNPSTLTITETDPQVSSTITNYIPKWNGTTLVDGQVFDNGTNVGVGTATPTTHFHVASDNSVTNTTIESGNLQYPTALNILPSTHATSRRTALKLDDWHLLQDLTGTGTKDFAIYQNSTGQQRITIGTTGNVGVGVNNPTEKLDVNGKTKTTNLQVTNGATNGYVLQSDATGNGTWVNPTSLSITETDPQVSSFLPTAVPKWNGTALVDGQIFDNGTNIGIGTVTPAEKLDVIGKTKTTDIQVVNGAVNGYVLRSDALGNGTWVNPSTLSITETDPQVSSSTANYLPKWNGTTLVDGQVFDNGTNVGIGNNSPNALLTIGSNISPLLPFISKLSVNTTGNSPVFVGESTGLKGIIIGYDGNNIQGRSGANFAANSDLILNNYGGNVGINTTTPTEKLDVNGKTKTTNLQITNGATNGSILQSDATGNGTWVNPSTLTVTETDPQVSSSVVNYVPRWIGSTLDDGSIQDDGNSIGIATAPVVGNRLTVNGKTATTNIQITNGANTGYVFQSDATGNGTWVNPSSLTVTETDPQVSSTTTNYIPKWNGTTLVDGQVFDNGTNVGIGTTTPTDKVHVVGNLKIDGGKLPFINTGNSVFIGEFAGFNDDLSNNENTFIGTFAGAGNRSGQFNTAIGRGAMNNITSSNDNVSVGFNTLNNLINNHRNTAIGNYAGFSNLGNGNIFLGFTAGYNETGSNKLYIDNSTTSTPLIWGDFTNDYVNINGNLGVGTTTPTQAKLVVNGNESNTLANYGFLNRTTPTGITNPGVTASYSIYASHRIAASEFNAFSDARIKNIKGISNSKQDLETLSKIEITNYTLKDTIAKGVKNYKKVIAQQIEKVYPQAVSQLTDVVPDIYKQAEIKNGFIALENNLKVGEKVKIISQKGEEIVEVKETNSKGFKTSITSNGLVFVYGRQVSDFRSVDYEALSTLNISATQELLKRIEQLEQENKTLKVQVSAIDQLKAEMQEIKNSIQKENNLLTKN